jgi:putative aldouronate transport system permease protein
MLTNGGTILKANKTFSKDRFYRRLKAAKLNYDMYLILLPSLIYILIFNYLPLYGIIIAFKDYNMFAGSSPLDAIAKSPYVGFANFARLFRSPDFLRVFRNTLTISLYKMFYLFPLPILLALLLNEIRNLYFKRGLQTVLYLPHFISWPVVSGIFVALLSSTGIINNLIKSLGGDPIMFLMDKRYFRSVLVVTDGWKSVGWSSIIYLAAISGVDMSLYEAARVDGAGKLSQTWHVTLPSITPTIIMLLVLNVGGILEAGFQQIFIMYNPIVYEVADIIGTYVYRVGLGQMQFGFGTAVGLFNSVVAFILIISSNYLSRRSTGRSIW